MWNILRHCGTGGNHGLGLPAVDWAQSRMSAGFIDRDVGTYKVLLYLDVQR